MKDRPQLKKNVVIMNQRTNVVSDLTSKKKVAVVTSASKVITATRNSSTNSSSNRQSSRNIQRINWHKIGRGAILGAIVLIVIIASYGLLCSSYFRATSVSIDGVKLLEANTLSQQVETALEGHFWQIWRGNFWLASTKRFCKPLEDYNLISCRLKRQWPNKLTLKVKEEPVVAIWQENGWYYWVDRFGRVVKQELPNLDSAKLYPIVNSQDSLVNDRQVAISQDLWSLIVASQTDWLGEAPRNFNFNSQEPNSLQAVLTNQQVVKLTLRSSLADQLKLWQSGQSKFTQQLSQAKVIDLRYGDRIIFQ